ncbi:hypothetical protein MNO14_12145 [Luteimonas sp. S4-F44]|uniref:hypothetical protein n=1 Tax=Luteimonas sp. S4-F44 TaxID=2925842 RepID=UPI001F535B50|nr:hypothetical protein [Luteimonas sp. S4-F44]UNK41706.1 hypothetical protein MNO14_12145 [Luteimonas sp. S4-F44]
MRADRTALALCVALALAACGDRDAQRGNAADGNADTAGLPQPVATGDAVTGMPGAPGPGDVPLGGRAPVPEVPDLAAVPLEDNPETGLLPAATDASVDTAPPTPEAAVAAIRGYYAAINALDYASAYAVWSDGGRASGQTPEQFAAGFAQTSTVMVDIGTPGPIDAAAGSRYIEVPVSLRAQQADGSIRRYEGHYVLRAAVVDGASQTQRAWHIASADLREVAAP